MDIEDIILIVFAIIVGLFLLILMYLWFTGEIKECYKEERVKYPHSGILNSKDYIHEDSNNFDGYEKICVKGKNYNRYVPICIYK